MDVLVFGGNGFIGGATVLQLLQDHRVTVVNRGKSWDWDKANTVRPHVTCVEWNRQRPLVECIELQTLLQKNNFKVIIDFSAYNGKAVKDVCNFLQNKIGLYIYISSDSVYEVCERQNGETKLTLESEAVRPVSRQKYKELKRQDSYGHKKLKGEEELIKAQQVYKFKYIILRLADVIGPRDSTDRWWSLQLWVTWCCHMGATFYLPAKRKSTLLSLVYVEDVAEFIANLVKDYTNETLPHESINEAYNLACTETTTLELMVKQIASCVSSNNVQIEYSSNPNISEYYPSVERGPIDITKAKSLLKWQPTQFETVVKRTVQFYQNCVKSKDIYVKEKGDIYNELYKDLKKIYCKNDLKKLANLLNL